MNYYHTGHTNDKNTSFIESTNMNLLINDDEKMLSQNLRIIEINNKNIYIYHNNNID